MGRVASRVTCVNASRGRPAERAPRENVGDDLDHVCPTRRGVDGAAGSERAAHACDRGDDVSTSDLTRPPAGSGGGIWPRSSTRFDAGAPFPVHTEPLRILLVED